MMYDVQSLTAGGSLCICQPKGKLSYRFVGHQNQFGTNQGPARNLETRSPQCTVRILTEVRDVIYPAVQGFASSQFVHIFFRKSRNVTRNVSRRF